MIGLGRMGLLHARGYAAAGAEVVAGADPSPAARAAFAEATGARSYPSTAAMLEAEGPAAVSVASPPFAHLDDVRRAVALGLHVLCEKPLAPSTAAALEIVELARQTPSVFMVAFFNRFLEPVAWTLRRLADPALDVGAVRSIDICFNPGPQPQRPWQADRAVSGGGPILNNLIHAVDLVRQICVDDPVVDAVAYTRTDPRVSREVEADGYGLLRTAAGTVVRLESCALAARRRFSLRIECERAAFDVSWNPPGATLSRPGRQPEAAPVSTTDPLARIDAGVAAFVSAACGVPPTGLPTHDDAWAATQLVDLLYRSSVAFPAPLPHGG